MKYIVLLIALTASFNTCAAVHSLQELLEQVRQDKWQEQQLNAQRITEFQAARDQQAQRLEQARQELKQLQATQKALQDDINTRQQALQQQREQLALHSQDLQTLFNGLRQLASDIRPRLTQSFITAEYPARAAQLQALEDGTSLPTFTQVKQLWYSLLEDMVASAQISRFQTPVITVQGQEETREVLRVGSFNITSQGEFLRYLPTTGKLMILPQQPAQRWQQLALSQQQRDSGWGRAVIDPSQGEVLHLLAQTPTWFERVQQGGMIAYFIIGLGVLGLLIVIERWLMLWLIRKRMRHQLKHAHTPHNNPLGRVLAVYHTQPERDVETLELKLDEAILREMPALRRGLSAVGVLAAIAPLLGLLGTVTGIIHTFQAMTLQGAGDPKIMSGGISEALVTTELGLIVAIPLLLSHSVLRSLSNTLIHLLDEQSAALIARQAEKAK